MKLRHIFLSTLLIFSCMSLRAQHVYVEAGGASTTAGVHYDSRFNDHTRWGGRIGVAYTYSRSPDFLPSAPDKTTGWSFPVAVNYLIGGKQHYLELGIGVCYGLYQCTSTARSSHIVESQESGTFGFIDIGYRFQSSMGWMLRAGLSPGMGLDRTNEMGDKEPKINRAKTIYPYLGIGYSF